MISTIDYLSYLPELNILRYTGARIHETEEKRPYFYHISSFPGSVLVYFSIQFLILTLTPHCSLCCSLFLCLNHFKNLELPPSEPILVAVCLAVRRPRSVSTLLTYYVLALLLVSIFSSASRVKNYKLLQSLQRIISRNPGIFLRPNRGERLSYLK